MAEYVKVAQMSDIARNSVRGLKVNGQEIAVVNLDGQFFAVSDICSHAHCNLSDGDIEGGNIWCPCHGSEFNVKTGAVMGGPAQEDIASYPVRIEGNDVLVGI